MPTRRVRGLWFLAPLSWEAARCRVPLVLESLAFLFRGLGFGSMAAQMGQGSAAAGTSSSESEIEKMMAELGLREADMDDVVVDEGAIPRDAARWMAVSKVHIDKPYSQGWFFRNMRAAWDLAQEVNFKPLEPN